MKMKNYYQADYNNQKQIDDEMELEMEQEMRWEELVSDDKKLTDMLALEMSDNIAVYDTVVMEFIKSYREGSRTAVNLMEYLREKTWSKE